MGKLTLMRPKRMLVRLEALDTGKLLASYLAVEIDARWIVIEDALSTGDLIHAIIWMRRHHSVLHRDIATLIRLYK